MLLHLPRMEGYRPGETVKNGPPLAGHGAEAVREAIAQSMAKLPPRSHRCPPPVQVSLRQSEGLIHSRPVIREASSCRRQPTPRPIMSLVLLGNVAFVLDLFSATL